MTLLVKKRMTTCLLWGLACYCGFCSFFSVKSILIHFDSLLSFGILFWVIFLILLSGLYFYIRFAFNTQRGTLDIDKIPVFQFFSGIFAGSGTKYFWFFVLPKYAESVVSENFYFWVTLNCVASIAALVAAIAVTRLYLPTIGLRRLFFAFGSAVFLFAVFHIAIQVGVGEIDPRILLAGTAFLVFAYFFPTAAQVIVNGAVIVFAGIFAIVGSIFNRRGY